MSVYLYLTHADECRRLKAEGLLISEISTRLGIGKTTVSMALASPEEQARIRESKNGKKRKPQPDKPVVKAKSIKYPPIPKEAKDEAILAFAMHQIDRNEMLRRITPRDKWREEWVS